MKQISQTANFSLTRLMAVISNMWANNKRLYILGGITLAGVFMLIAASISKNVEGEFAITDQEYSELPPAMTCTGQFMMNMTGLSYYGVALVFALITGSMMFNNFKSQTSRTAELMLPANMTEKFIARLFYTVVGTLVVITIAVTAGELTRYLTISNPNNFSGVWALNIGRDTPLHLCVPLFSLVLLQSIFALSSCISPTYSFFKTFIAIFCFINVVALLPFNAERFLNDTLNWSDPRVCVIEEAILIVAIYAITWWRFRKIQVVQRFMAK